MKTSSLASLVVAATLLPAFGSASTMLVADFESPSYIFGDINGQHGWVTTPNNVIGYIQNDVVLSGKQAIALGGAGRTATAEMPVKADANGAFTASVGINYQPMPTMTNKSTPCAAGMMRLSGNDIKGNTVAIEFGFSQAASPMSSSRSVTNQYSAFAHVVVNGKVMTSASAVIPDNLRGGWHRYGVQVNAASRSASLTLDGKVVARFSTSVSMTMIDTLALQANMPCSSPEKSLMYFDDISLGVL